MTQTIITAGDASAPLAFQGGDDGTLVIKTGAAGSKVNALSFAADGTPTFLRGGMVLGTAVATTSGTSIDFTGIPSWVKRITVSLSGVSTNGTSTVQLQIGAGSVQTTGYASGSTQSASGVAAAITVINTGMYVAVPTAANMTAHGAAVFTLLNAATGLWAYSSNTTDDTNGRNWASAGSKTLSGTLDRIRLTTVNGTDTFDAGSVNILYEG
jgi:hypothetical protein